MTFSWKLQRSPSSPPSWPGPAFANVYNPLNNTQYVDTLLNTAGVTLSSRQALIDGLTSSTLTRAQVPRQIVESTEVSTRHNHQAYAVMEYFGYLRRQPDAFYLDWIAELDRTNNPRVMVTGFVNSAEYRRDSDLNELLISQCTRMSY